MQAELEGRNVSKVKICFSGETPGDTYRPLDGDTKGGFRSHSEEVVVHAGMDNFHRSLVSGVAVTATYLSAILTVDRDKKREMFLAVISKYKKREISLAVSSKYRKREISLEASNKDGKYRSDIMAAQIVAYIISKENTTQQVSFANEQVDNMKDVSMPRMFISKNRHYSTPAEDLSKRWGLSIS